MIRLTLKNPYAADCPDDVVRMRAILNAKGYDASPALIAAAYGRWSDENYGASWHRPSRADDAMLFNLLMTQLEPEASP